MYKSESHDTNSTFIFRTHQIKREKIWKLWCFYANITPQIQMMMIMMMRWKKNIQNFLFGIQMWSEQRAYKRVSTCRYKEQNRTEPPRIIGFYECVHEFGISVHPVQKQKKSFEKEKVKKAFKRVIFFNYKTRH